MKTKLIKGLWYQENQTTIYQWRVIGDQVLVANFGGGTNERQSGAFRNVEEFQTKIDGGSIKLIPGQKLPLSPAERVRRVLKTLAERKDIAGYLKKKGIKGYPRSACSCIIARFVRTVTGHAISVVPNCRDPYWTFNKGDRYRLRKNLADLANAFDRDELPELSNYA